MKESGKDHRGVECKQGRPDVESLGSHSNYKASADGRGS